MRVGQEVRFTLTVANLDNTGRVDIMVVEDPGVPIGMSLVPSPMSAGCFVPNKICRDVVWTPRKVLVYVGHIHATKKVSFSMLVMQPMNWRHT